MNSRNPSSVMNAGQHSTELIKTNLMVALLASRSVRSNRSGQCLEDGILPGNGVLIGPRLGVYFAKINAKSEFIFLHDHYDRKCNFRRRWFDNFQLFQLLHCFTYQLPFTRSTIGLLQLNFRGISVDFHVIFQIPSFKVFSSIQRIS